MTTICSACLRARASSASPWFSAIRTWTSEFVNCVCIAARAGAITAAPVDFGVSDPKVAAVLRAFLADGRLTSIPAGGRKRTIVLEYLATTFEPGQRYPEPAVNAILAAFHPDTAALRRYLVNEGFLSRADGIYWRSGGWVDVS